MDAPIQDAPVPSEQLMATVPGLGRSPRSGLGRTWWARQWLAVLQARCPRQVLDQGRRDARRGRVTDVVAERGIARGAVKETETRIFYPSLSVVPLDADQEKAMLAELAGQSRYPAALLAGILPEELPARFAALGARFFPEPPDEPGLGCSCPSGNRYCRHQAALQYRLGELLEQDPFILLALRGLSKERLMGLWRRSWGAEGESADPAAAGEGKTGAFAPTRFYRLGGTLPPAYRGTPPAAGRPAVIELLGFPPFFPAGDRTVLQTLENLYDES